MWVEINDNKAARYCCDPEFACLHESIAPQVHEDSARCRTCSSAAMCSCSGGSSVDAANQSISSPLTPELCNHQAKSVSYHAHNKDVRTGALS